MNPGCLYLPLLSWCLSDFSHTRRQTSDPMFGPHGWGMPAQGHRFVSNSECVDRWHQRHHQSINQHAQSVCLLLALCLLTTTPPPIHLLAQNYSAAPIAGPTLVSWYIIMNTDYTSHCITIYFFLRTEENFDLQQVRRIWCRIRIVVTS